MVLKLQFTDEQLGTLKLVIRAAMNEAYEGSAGNLPRMIAYHTLKCLLAEIEAVA